MNTAFSAEAEPATPVYAVVQLDADGAVAQGAPTRTYRTDPYCAAQYYAQAQGIDTGETAGEIRSLGDGMLVVRFRPSTGFPVTVRVTVAGAFWPERIEKSGNKLPRRYVKSARTLDDGAAAKLAAVARAVLN
jgi:hypothetical protein